MGDKLSSQSCVFDMFIVMIDRELHALKSLEAYI